MYAPHTVTVYNTTVKTDKSTFRDVVENHITVLRGVFRDSAEADRVRLGGRDSADTVRVLIPFTVDARDGVTGTEKRFADPAVFREADDKSALWTLTTDGKTFFVDGEVIEPDGTAETLEKTHEVYAVTRVQKCDFGSESMRHWEVGGA